MKATLLAEKKKNEGVKTMTRERNKLSMRRLQTSLISGEFATEVRFVDQYAKE